MVTYPIVVAQGSPSNHLTAVEDLGSGAQQWMQWSLDVGFGFAGLLMLVALATFVLRRM